MKSQIAPFAANHQAPIFDHQPRTIRRAVDTMLLAVCALFICGSAVPAHAGRNHAHVVLGVRPKGDCEPDNQTAYAYLIGKAKSRKNLWVAATEGPNENSIQGNAGYGHAHHHSRNNCDLQSQDSDVGAAALPAPVRLGWPGTSLFVHETWLPNPAGDEITVSLTPDSFLQVDLNQLTPTNPLSVRADLDADGGIAGSIILSAWMDDNHMPHVETNLTGVFEGSQFALVPYENGVVSLQLLGPQSWTVPGQVETFDTEIESAIEGVSDIGPNAQ